MSVHAPDCNSWLTQQTALIVVWQTSAEAPSFSLLLFPALEVHSFERAASLENFTEVVA